MTYYYDKSVRLTHNNLFFFSVAVLLHRCFRYSSFFKSFNNLLYSTSSSFSRNRIKFHFENDGPLIAFLSSSILQCTTFPRFSHFAHLLLRPLCNNLFLQLNFLLPFPTFSFSLSLCVYRQRSKPIVLSDRISFLLTGQHLYPERERGREQKGERGLES